MMLGGCGRDRVFWGKGKTCFEVFPLGLSIKDRLAWTAPEKKRLQQCITLVPIPMNQLTPSDEILKTIRFHQ